MEDKTKMELWDRLEDTDPATTTRVNHRGGFTAIDAYSQIKRATEEWGPVGVGWGWEIKNVHIIPEHSVIVEIRMWHSGDRDAYFDDCGQSDLMLRSEGGVRGPDADAVKKATTDALTKSLSRIGMNASVFLGKFENNKYVEKMTKKYDAIKKEKKTQEIIDNLKTVEGTDKWETWVAKALKIRDQVGDAGMANIEFYVDQVKKRQEPDLTESQK